MKFNNNLILSQFQDNNQYVLHVKIKNYWPKNNLQHVGYVKDGKK